MKKVLIISLITIQLTFCTSTQKDPSISFMVADPGHFHAALVLKSMYAGVNPKVFVYAPEGPDLDDFNGRVDGYQKRAVKPTGWQISEFHGSGYFDKMIFPGTTKVLFINFGAEEEKYCLKKLSEVRQAGISAEIYPEAAKLNKQMNYANQKGIPFVILIGSEEMKTGIITLKNMLSGEQKKIDFATSLLEIKRNS